MACKVWLTWRNRAYIEQRAEQELLIYAGPCLSTHTACSSSLVATHLAHTGLLNGEAEFAASCGVFMVLLQDTMSGIAQLQALSPVGRCKTFDSSGDGYGRGEGCAVMIMRPSGNGSGDALALVRSTVVNQDGRSSSLTAPNGPSQTTLVSTALQGIGEPVQDDRLSKPANLCSYSLDMHLICRRGACRPDFCGGPRHRYAAG